MVRPLGVLTMREFFRHKQILDRVIDATGGYQAKDVPVLLQIGIRHAVMKMRAPGLRVFGTVRG